MTNEDRREAKRLAKAYLDRVIARVVTEYKRNGDLIGARQTLDDDEGAFVAGYAAACEAKRAELDRLEGCLIVARNQDAIGRFAAKDFSDKLEAERARSEKLMEALTSIAAPHLSSDQIKACGGDEVVTDTEIARAALAEYEASRD